MEQATSTGARSDMGGQQVQLDIRPVAGSLGAEIHGVNLRGPLSEGLRAALRSAWLKHLVLFFPGQHLNSSEHQAFGASWGKLATYAADKHVRSKDDPGVVELSAAEGYTADYWHTDLTHMSNPPMGSVLNMVKLPAVGGDTMWSNQYAAYESLSAPIRNLLDGLTAIHRHPRMTDSRAEHAVVGTHPETGRKFLYVNHEYTIRIAQLSRHESDALLQLLFAHSVQPQFTVRYRWSVGTVAIWDNRCTQHMVLSDFTGERVIQRVTLAGDVTETSDSPWERFAPTQNTIASRADRVDAP